MNDINEMRKNCKTVLGEMAGGIPDQEGGYGGMKGWLGYGGWVSVGWG